MSTAPRYVPHYTIEDYQHWEGDWELIDGIAIAMTPSPFGPHERVVSRLSRMIGNQLEINGCSREVYANLDWTVSNDTVVRPDVVITCGSVPDRHLESAPVLIAEILSPSTASKDKTIKRELYQQASENPTNYLALAEYTPTTGACRFVDNSR